MRASSEILNRAFETMRAQGVLRKDIQTTGVSVQPHFRYDSAGEHRDGYECDQSASFVIRGLSRAGTVIDAVVTAGGNGLQLSSAVPQVSDENPAREQARAQAIGQAKAKAADYARLTGRTLGEVLRIDETTAPCAVQPMPMMGLDRAAGSAAAPIRIQPGRQSVQIDVVTTWQLR